MLAPLAGPVWQMPLRQPLLLPGEPRLRPSLASKLMQSQQVARTPFKEPSALMSEVTLSLVSEVLLKVQELPESYQKVPWVSRFVVQFPVETEKYYRIILSTSKSWTCWIRSRGGHENSQRAGIPLPWGQAEKVWIVQPGEERAVRTPYCSLPLLEESL